MARHTWSLNRVLESLGIKGGLTPDVLEMVQPTLEVGDASTLTAPLLAPVALWGGLSTSDALTLSSWEIQARAQGGLAVRYFSYSNVATTPLAFRISATPFADPFPNNNVVHTPQSMNPDLTPVLHTVRTGGLASAVITPDNPQMRVPANSTGVLPDIIIVPPGQFLQIQKGGVAQLQTEFVLVGQDIVRFPGAP